MTHLLHTAAALAEIAGCFSVWAWWRLEGVRPDRWDFGGAALCIAGASLILLAPRGA
ncbi:hypothetical protein [Mesorhizobium sp. dw_380]|uniref:hypothetical protein n=1 Tax=Mesorhizobium sp. dw_380 TaxID=2812001 RepID=UPI001BDF4D2A|nr:hypothetical protein [Mesorhizobium sp. dw_380]